MRVSRGLAKVSGRRLRGSEAIDWSLLPQPQDIFQETADLARVIMETGYVPGRGKKIPKRLQSYLDRHRQEHAQEYAALGL